MSRSFTIHVDYDHSPPRVWRALTEREAIASWLMDNDFEPRVGHRFTLRTEPGPGFDGVVRCEVLELEPPGDGANRVARMVWSWRGGPIDTVVTFELQPTPRGTRLRVTQSGFSGVKGAIVRPILRGGSRTIYRRRLAAVLEQLASEDAPGAQTTAGVETIESPRACAPRGFWRRFAAAVAPLLERGSRGR